MRIVLEATSRAGIGICVEADAKTQVLRGDLEDNEVLEVAREADNGI